MSGPVTPRPRTYICGQCRGEFEYGWSDEEAHAEAKALFGRDGHDPGMAIICDECFQKVMGMSSCAAFPPPPFEVHTHQNRTLFDALLAAPAARRLPLVILLSPQIAAAHRFWAGEAFVTLGRVTTRDPFLQVWWDWRGGWAWWWRRAIGRRGWDLPSTDDRRWCAVIGPVTIQYYDRADERKARP